MCAAILTVEGPDKLSTNPLRADGNQTEFRQPENSNKVKQNACCVHSNPGPLPMYTVITTLLKKSVLGPSDRGSSIKHTLV